MRLTAYATTRDMEPAQRPEWLRPGDYRRMDPLTRRACQAVDGCLAGRRLDPDSSVLFACAYGSIISTLRFADSIGAYGDAAASPTPFTTSVHNASAGSLSQLLGLHGPSSTISEGNVSVSAALRWAMMMLHCRRTPAVLLVAGEEHCDWSRRTIDHLMDAPWRAHSGMAAVLLEADQQPGRPLLLGEHPARRCLDSGGMSAAERRRLAAAAAAAGQQRLCAPEILGGWWPTCLLAALPEDDEPLQLREQDGTCAHSWWLGSQHTGAET